MGTTHVRYRFFLFQKHEQSKRKGVGYGVERNEAISAGKGRIVVMLSAD